MMAFYSQYGEDRLLKSIFGDHVGTCIEVGANDGVTWSTTKYFEEIGWTCLLVEPTPALCEKIRARRSSRLFECAASSSDGVAKLGYVEDIDLYSSLETTSTMVQQIDARGASITTIEVPTRRVDSILEEASIDTLDFMTIDVEGHELSVLQGTDLGRWRPKILIVEDNTDLAESPVSLHLFDRNYVRFYRSGGNDWYRHKDDASFGEGDVLRLILAQEMSVGGFLRATLPVSLRSIVLRTLRKARKIS